MPGTNELLGLLIVIFIVWVVLKLARVAIRLIIFIIMAVIVLGALYWLFAR